ncbi:MAG TPA: T9SS type A sorting domain-containing protein, partial [Bacteroidia bacterium]|nr:T9SS type A sorting domain-containing protein [Bacteroidia bacterium]
AMCGIRHSNGIDFWVVAHKEGTAEFRAFEINSSGIQPPVSTSIGTVPNDISQMKSNAAGNRICYGQGSIIALYDFDNAAGILSNYTDLLQFGFGSSFAPGGNVLYTLGGPTAFTLGQFDLTASNIPASFTSIAIIPAGQHGEGMMLARDCKIYLAKGNNSYLDVINDPDVLGLGCNYVPNAVNLGSGICMYELPNNIDGLFAGLCNGLSTGETEGNPPFRIHPNPVSDVLFIVPSEFTNTLGITITDFTGKQIFKKEFSGYEQVKVDVKDFSDGMYLLEIQTGKERVVRKFVKNGRR